MIGWLLNTAYFALLLLASPILIWRMVTQGKYRQGWAEKFLGQLPESTVDDQVIWLHAVSVGEILQLRTLIARLQQCRPDHQILVTTTTATGHAVARKTFPECRIAYCPLDFTWAVKRAIRRVRPVLLGLVELELWPNLIRSSSAASVPLMLINGRISERSAAGYQHIQPLMRSLLQQFDTIAVQTDVYGERLIDLGAPPLKVHTIGSLKFDEVPDRGHGFQWAGLRTRLGLQSSERVFIAGSTHEPEEEIAIKAWRKVRSSHPELRLVIVPRHQERFDEVASLIERSRLSVVRKSGLPAKPAADPEAVLLIDTLGELSNCWRMADVAFVGGSLTRRGGQNMIEPAAAGVPVVVGPNTTNFRDVVEGLKSVGGIRLVEDEEQLASTVGQLLEDPVEAKRQADAARKFVLAQQGATDRTLGLVYSLLEGTTRQNRAA